MAKKNNTKDENKKSPEQIVLEEKEAKEKAKKEKKENDENKAQMNHYAELRDNATTPEEYEKANFWFKHYRALIK